MTGTARITLLACVIVLLLGLFIPIASAQTETSGTATGATTTPATPAPFQKTYGAPSGLHDTALALEGLFKQKKYADAHALCKQGFEAAADDETRAFFLRYDAETYMEERSPECEPLLKKVIEQFAQTTQASWAKMDLAEAYVHAALVIGNTEHYVSLALPLFDDFINNNPKHEKIARAYWWRAGLYERLENYQAALADYQKAADLYPTYPNGNECLMGAIKMLQKFQRWDDAITYARRYIELLPGSSPAPAQLSIGFSCAGKGDLAQAIQEFDKVLSQYPDARDQCAQALFQKGLALKALGQLDAARSAFEQLARDYPDQNLAAQAKQQLDLLAAQ